jgi:hypothetical protein
VDADAGPVPAGARRRAGLGVAFATGVVAAAVAGLAVDGPERATTAPVAASSPVLAALDPMPPAPVPAGPALRATEVRLPTLGVGSALVDLDVGVDGVLVPPADPDVAGWYRRGAVPGEQGPTVIAGHVDSRTGPAVFFHLDELAPGDPVQVARSDGRAFDYRSSPSRHTPRTRSRRRWSTARHPAPCCGW